ncbi:MAG: SPFH/Band 7/PHB domain protein [Thermoprotei archaeon]|nr:MAG: SPFH/Band 7/PHB domain protein [Thermoprotei archaeon]
MSLILLVVLVIAVVISRAVRIVREYARLIVFRLGRLIGARGPGLVLLVPFIDTAKRVDLREFMLDIPPQTCFTRDNAPVDIDLFVYLKVFDPVKSVIEVKDFVNASIGVTITTLRAVIGDLVLDDVLAKRDQINNLLRTKLDEITDRWGIKVTAVEIKEIRPPRDVQEAMVKQMAAERTRRAMILEASGKKQAVILEAEGHKEALIKEAEGEKIARLRKAEGYAMALEKINEAAAKIGSNTLYLQYLDALKRVGESTSTKIVIPLELSTDILKVAKKFIEGIG